MKLYIPMLAAVGLLSSCHNASPSLAKPSAETESGAASSAPDTPVQTLPDSPVPEEPGSECGAAEDCHPQAAAHAPWCGPIKHDFTEATVTAVFTPGTLDGNGRPLPNGEIPGCRCVNGYCGALLNDGRQVVGSQPEV